MNVKQNEHYNDGLVDVTVIGEFSLVVFVNIDGDSKTVGFDTNFFVPKDLLDAYGEIFGKDWHVDVGPFLDGYRKYLIESGCPEEDLA